jgi:hypothetical protein
MVLSELKQPKRILRLDFTRQLEVLYLLFLWDRLDLMAAKRTTRAPAKRTAPREIPVLTLKVNGPKVRKGRISVPDLIKICSDAQNAVTRQAEALEGRKSLHPGPTTGQIRQECTLELMAIRDGSTMLDFSLAKPQLPLPFDDAKSFGTEAVGEVAETIRSLGNGNQQQDIDPGVLQRDRKSVV